MIDDVIGNTRMATSNIRMAMMCLGDGMGVRMCHVFMASLSKVHESIEDIVESLEIEKAQGGDDGPAFVKKANEGVQGGDDDE